jgi:hypothetical protein
VPQRHDTACPVREILHQDLRDEIEVLFVSPLAAPDQNISIPIEGHGFFLFDLPFDLLQRHALVFDPFQIRFADQGVSGKFAHRFLEKTCFNRQNIEVIADLHHSEKFIFGHDLSEGSFSRCAGKIVLKPRSRGFPKIVRVHIPDKDLVRRIRHGFFEWIQMAQDLVKHRRIRCDFP